MNVLFRFFAVLFMVTRVAQAQIPFPGRCPAVKVVSDFKSSDYLGTWYENKKYFAIFQAGGTCTTATYSNDQSNPGQIGVVNRQWNQLLRRYSTIVGSARLAGEPNEAKLKVKFPITGGMESDYWVLGTDYQTFSVVYSCRDLYFFNVKFAWVLTRERNPAPSVIAAADEVLKANNVSLTAFSVTSQENCP